MITNRYVKNKAKLKHFDILFILLIAFSFTCTDNLDSNLCKTFQYIDCFEHTTNPIYRIDIDLNYKEHILLAKLCANFHNNSNSKWENVIFCTPFANNKEKFILTKLEIYIKDRVVSNQPEFFNIMMNITLPVTLHPGEKIMVCMEFILNLDEIDPGAYTPLGNCGWSARLIQAGDWHPYLVPYDDNKGWTTWDYHPVGDPNIYSWGDYYVHIKAPENVNIVTCGLIKKTDSSWFFHIKNARCFSFFASPYFNELKSSYNGIPLRCYNFAGQYMAALAIIDAAKKSLELFKSKYGPFPYPELVITQNDYMCGMEYSGFITIGDYAFNTYDGTAKCLLPPLTAHEISHQWWYGAVGNDQVYHSWLDESLAMYSEVLFYEEYYPQLIDWWWWYRVDLWKPGGYVDAEIYDYEDGKTFIFRMYGQACYFIQELRDLIGDEAFFSFLKEYYQQGIGKIITPYDFFSILRSNTDEDIAKLQRKYFKQIY